jgi:hypothetical protein
MFFAFHYVTFCDTNLSQWDYYIEKYAKNMLENDSTPKSNAKGYINVWNVNGSIN